MVLGASRQRSFRGGSKSFLLATPSCILLMGFAIGFSVHLMASRIFTPICSSPSGSKFPSSVAPGVAEIDVVNGGAADVGTVAGASMLGGVQSHGGAQDSGSLNIRGSGTQGGQSLHQAEFGAGNADGNDGGNGGGKADDSSTSADASTSSELSGSDPDVGSDTSSASGSAATPRDDLSASAGGGSTSTASPANAKLADTDLLQKPWVGDLPDPNMDNNPQLLDLETGSAVVLAAAQHPRRPNPKHGKFPPEWGYSSARGLPLMSGGPKWKGPYGPDPSEGPVTTTTGPRKGLPCKDCIFVAVTTCCSSWKNTRILLSQLLASDDNLHVAVFDDYSEDGTLEKVTSLGIRVMQPTKGLPVGLTAEMNLAWRYFYARPELDTMWIVNNDIQLSPVRTFAKLSRCAHSFEGPGVVGPMTNALGLGTGTHMAAYLSWQNAEHSRHRPAYGEVKLPTRLTSNLPGSLVDYNYWLEDHLGEMAGNTTKRVKTLMGMFMGFRKDHPLHRPEENRAIHGSRNAGQEYEMFQTQGVPAYVCHDVFVFHDKSATNNPHVLAAMEHNKAQTNKKDQVAGVQS